MFIYSVVIRVDIISKFVYSDQFRIAKIISEGIVLKILKQLYYVFHIDEKLFALFDSVFA